MALKWQDILDVLKAEGGTKTLPRLEADQATREGFGEAGSKPWYTSPEEVVMFVMRPWAEASGTVNPTTARNSVVKRRMAIAETGDEWIWGRTILEDWAF